MFIHPIQRILFSGCKRTAKCISSTTPSNHCYATLKMPDCEITPEAFHGNRTKVLEQRKSFMNPALTTYYSKPVILHKGYKQWLWDIDNKRYLDLFPGIVTVSVGHCHPKVNQAAKEQMDKIWHSTNIYMQPSIHEYAEKLAEKMPGNLKVCCTTCFH